MFFSDGKPDDPQWRSLVANTPVFVLILDPDQRIVFANHTDSGGDISRIIGRRIYDFCRPEARADVRACMEQGVSTGQPGMYEAPALRLDGEEHWYATDFGPIFTDGRLVAVSAISTNVTARKRAEAAVRQSKQRMRLHVQQTPLAVIEWDTRPASPNGIGRRNECSATPKGSDRSSLSFFVPGTARDQVGQLRDALLARKGGERSTNENVTKDGRTICASGTTRPGGRRRPGNRGGNSLAEDITDRKRRKGLAGKRTAA